MKVTEKSGKMFLLTIFCIVLVFGLILLGCENSSGSDGNANPVNPVIPVNPFVGTWRQDTSVGSQFLIFTDTTWENTTAYVRNSGTYTYNGNNAILRDASGHELLLVTIIAQNKLTASGAIFTKQ